MVTVLLWYEDPEAVHMRGRALVVAGPFEKIVLGVGRIHKTPAQEIIILVGDHMSQHGSCSKVNERPLP